MTYGDSYIHVGNENVGIYCFGDVVEGGKFFDATTTRRMRKPDHEEWVGIIGARAETDEASLAAVGR